MSGAIGSNDQAWSLQFALLEFINEVRRHGTFTARLSRNAIDEGHLPADVTQGINIPQDSQ